MNKYEKNGSASRSGPLVGVKVLEMAGIGPAPFCGMLLSDLGADVLRVDRVEAGNFGLPIEPRFDCTSRGRRSVAADLKDPEGARAVRELASRADALIEGFRPGVMERLGLGPTTLMEMNPRLVYGRVTGWGQFGPLAHAAGHDLNYIAISGALHGIGGAGQAPTVPLNLVGDYGGGAAYLAFGIACALLHAARSGKGQVVDAAMSDGAASLMTLFYGRFAGGEWNDRRASNQLDGGAPWYDSYETADGKYVSIGPVEPKFFYELLARVGLDVGAWQTPHDPACWPALRERLKRTFKMRSRDQWCDILEGSDACFAPVMGLAEAPLHPHNIARETFVRVDGVLQPAPCPRFSETPGSISGGAPSIGEGGRQALEEWGFNDEEVAGLSSLVWKK